MEFVDFKIKEIAKVTAGGDKPKIVSNSYSDETPIPIYSNGMENDGLYGYTNIPKVDADTVTISARGVNVGKVCYRETAFLPIVRLLSLIPNRSVINAKYMYYNLKMMNISGTGSAQPQITVPMISELKMHIHKDLIEQEKIASFLSVLDEKIKNNNRINRNLSEQMQAIFGSIFYSEMEKGNKASLGDYLYIKGRIGWKGLKKEEYLSESEYRIINGESLTVTGIDWNKAGYISEERYIESPEIMLQEGDILISKDGTIGKIGYVNKLDKPTSVASGIFVVRNLKPEEVSTVFIYCLLNSDYFKSFIASRTEGSVIPHLYQKDFVTLEIPILSQEQIELFNSTVVPLFELFFSNQTENIRLAALRDSLLPKLMSGELDVLDLDI